MKRNKLTRKLKKCGNFTLSLAWVYLRVIESGGNTQFTSKYCSNCVVPYKLTPNKASVMIITTTCKKCYWKNIDFIVIRVKLFAKSALFLCNNYTWVEVASYWSNRPTECWGVQASLVSFFVNSDLVTFISLFFFSFLLSAVMGTSLCRLHNYIDLDVTGTSLYKLTGHQK